MDFSTVKDVIRQRLDDQGVLGKIRTDLGVAVYSAVNGVSIENVSKEVPLSRNLSTSSSNVLSNTVKALAKSASLHHRRADVVKNDQIALLVFHLIVNFLDCLGLSSARSILLNEAGVSQGFLSESLMSRSEDMIYILKRVSENLGSQLSSSNSPEPVVNSVPKASISSRVCTVSDEGTSSRHEESSLNKTVVPFNSTQSFISTFQGVEHTNNHNSDVESLFLKSASAKMSSSESDRKIEDELQSSLLYKIIQTVLNKNSDRSFLNQCVPHHVVPHESPPHSPVSVGSGFLESSGASFEDSKGSFSFDDQVVSGTEINDNVNAPDGLATRSFHSAPSSVIPLTEGRDADDSSSTSALQHDVNVEDTLSHPHYKMPNNANTNITNDSSRPITSIASIIGLGSVRELAQILHNEAVKKGEVDSFEVLSGENRASNTHVDANEHRREIVHSSSESPQSSQLEAEDIEENADIQSSDDLLCNVENPKKSDKQEKRSSSRDPDPLVSSLDESNMRVAVELGENAWSPPTLSCHTVLNSTSNASSSLNSLISASGDDEVVSSEVSEEGSNVGKNNSLPSSTTTQDHVKSARNSPLSLSPSRSREAIFDSTLTSSSSSHLNLSPPAIPGHAGNNQVHYPNGGALISVPVTSSPTRSTGSSSMNFHLLSLSSQSPATVGAPPNLSSNSSMGMNQNHTTTGSSTGSPMAFFGMSGLASLNGSTNANGSLPSTSTSGAGVMSPVHLGSVVPDVNSALPSSGNVPLSPSNSGTSPYITDIPFPFSRSPNRAHAHTNQVHHTHSLTHPHALTHPGILHYQSNNSNTGGTMSGSSQNTTSVLTSELTMTPPSPPSVRPLKKDPISQSPPLPFPGSNSNSMSQGVISAVANESSSVGGYGYGLNSPTHLLGAEGGSIEFLSSPLTLHLNHSSMNPHSLSTNSLPISGGFGGQEGSSGRIAKGKGPITADFRLTSSASLSTPVAGSSNVMSSAAGGSAVGIEHLHSLMTSSVTNGYTPIVGGTPSVSTSSGSGVSMGNGVSVLLGTHVPLSVPAALLQSPMTPSTSSNRSHGQSPPPPNFTVSDSFPGNKDYGFGYSYGMGTELDDVGFSDHSTISESNTIEVEAEMEVEELDHNGHDNSHVHERQDKRNEKATNHCLHLSVGGSKKNPDLTDSTAGTHLVEVNSDDVCDIHLSNTCGERTENTSPQQHLLESDSDSVSSSNIVDYVPPAHNNSSDPESSTCQYASILSSPSGLTTTSRGSVTGKSVEDIHVKIILPKGLGSVSDIVDTEFIRATSRVLASKGNKTISFDFDFVEDSSRPASLSSFDNANERTAIQSGVTKYSPSDISERPISSAPPLTNPNPEDLLMAERLGCKENASSMPHLSSSSVSKAQLSAVCDASDNNQSIDDEDSLYDFN